MRAGLGRSLRDASGSARVKPPACQGDRSWEMHFMPAPVGLLVALMHPQWEMRLSGRLSASALGSPWSPAAAHMGAGLQGLI